MNTKFSDTNTTINIVNTMTILHFWSHIISTITSESSCSSVLAILKKTESWLLDWTRACLFYAIIDLHLQNSNAVGQKDLREHPYQLTGGFH